MLNYINVFLKTDPRTIVFEYNRYLCVIMHFVISVWIETAGRGEASLSTNAESAIL